MGSALERCRQEETRLQGLGSGLATHLRSIARIGPIGDTRMHAGARGEQPVPKAACQPATSSAEIRMWRLLAWRMLAGASNSAPSSVPSTSSDPMAVNLSKTLTLLVVLAAATACKSKVNPDQARAELPAAERAEEVDDSSGAAVPPAAPRAVPDDPSGPVVDDIDVGGDDDDSAEDEAPDDDDDGAEDEAPDDDDDE